MSDQGGADFSGGKRIKYTVESTLADKTRVLSHFWQIPACGGGRLLIGYVFHYAMGKKYFLLGERVCS